jgi:hypothetical protein
MQVAAAPPVAGHAVHRSPQLFTLLLSAHVPSQSCVPLGHCVPHSPPTHVAVAPPEAGHGAHRVPQVLGLVLLAQVPLQS